MNVLFRCDTGTQIGTGHLMRCLTLAQALREQGVDCSFVCRDHPGANLEQVTQNGFTLHTLAQPSGNYRAAAHDLEHAIWLGVSQQQDLVETHLHIGHRQFDWLIVDHYALDIHWERPMRDIAQRILVIDDLADRAHDCNILLDQNLGRTEENYKNFLKKECLILLGPRFALLRPEFITFRTQALSTHVANSCLPLRNILISMGGIDLPDATSAILNALPLCFIPTDVKISVVMGQKAPALSKVTNIASMLPWQVDVLIHPPNMASLMVCADIAIGAAGSTSWERCCLGLPALLITTAPNQIPIASGLMGANAALGAGSFPCDDLAIQLASGLAQLQTASVYDKLSQAASALCDGAGVSRLLNKLMTNL